MATYDLKFDLFNFFSLQHNNKTLAVYVTGDEAQIDKRWKQGETFSLGWFRKPMKDFTLTDEGISGTTYGWSDSPVTSIRTHQEGGSDNQPYHYYDDFTVGSNGNDNYRICLYFGLDNNNIPCLRVLVYNVSSETYAYDGSNSYFNSPQKSDGCLYWSMGSGYLGGLTLNGTLVEGIHIPTSYGTTYACVCELCTNIPVFDTHAHAQAYCETLATDGLLNMSGDPEQEYENQFKFHFIKNIYGHNTQNASSYTGYRNYRFYPASKRMCFYRVNPTASNPYTVRLMGYDSGVTVKSAPVYADPLTDDDKYTTHSGAPELLYLHKSISFGSNDYYSKFRFYTDLPVYGSESQARDYINNVIDERSAENWNDISRAYSETFDPHYGDPDTGNDNGVNGQSYVKGARLWVMESTDLNNFFDDIFNDVNIGDILSGCQLFGQSAISCIMGVMYLPIDVDDVATVYSAKQTIKLGSWACPTAKGRYVQNNNKIIDCGSFFVARVYNDFRDYEMKLSLDLPYIGTVETSIGRFLGKTLSIKYAVDITTGGCTAHIYADSLEMESYDGFMASVRPIQALDQISHLNAVMGIVGSIGGRETGMINTAVEGFAGVATGNIGGSSNGGFNAPSSGVGLGGALDLSAGAISDLYSLGQAIKDKPIAVRGSYAGCLGLFGCQKIHIRVQQPRIYRAPNLQQIAGFPSGVGQRVGMFSGFLSVISFQMVDGFTGTADELEEIYSILKQGIYI